MHKKKTKTKESESRIEQSVLLLQKRSRYHFICTDHGGIRCSSDDRRTESDQ